MCERRQCKPRSNPKMRPLMKLFVTFCLVSLVLSLPLPEGEGDDGSTTEQPPQEESDAEKGSEPAGDDAAGGGEKEAEGGGNEDNANSEDKGESQGAGDAEGSSKSKQGEGKDDRLNTYNKVNELLDKDTVVDKIDNSFLRSFLDNNLQSHLRVPIVDAIGLIGDYSKIANCFKSMGSEVKKIIDENVKSFTTCKSKKESSDSKCAEENSNSAGGQFDQITSKIKECVSSSKGGK